MNQKVKINQKKTKAMIFKFTNNHQFTTSLELNGENLDLVSEIKLLGAIIKNYLRKLCEFGAPMQDLKQIIYITYIRRILEQSSIVWHSSLTEKKNNLSKKKCTNNHLIKMTTKNTTNL